LWLRTLVEFPSRISTSQQLFGTLDGMAFVVGGAASLLGHGRGSVHDAADDDAAAAAGSRL
jgi:hypothetical protein